MKDLKKDVLTPEGRAELYLLLTEGSGSSVPHDLVLRLKPTEDDLMKRIKHLEGILEEMGGQVGAIQLMFESKEW